MQQRIERLDDALTLVRSVAPVTPLQAIDLDLRGTDVLVKREDLGPGGSFKWRGALCACTSFAATGASGVVTASTGNHGAAVAWAARRVGMVAHVVVPIGANRRKCQLITNAGAQLHSHGSDLDEAAQEAKRLAAAEGFTYFEDGSEPSQILGTQTIGHELRDSGADVVIIPLGCGALAAGISQALVGLERPPLLIGVQATTFGRFAALFRGDPDPLRPTGQTVADGLAENRIVEPAFSICCRNLSDILLVDDAAMLVAGHELWRRMGQVVEPAAAATLAALWLHAINRGRIILIISGSNVDPELTYAIQREPGAERPDLLNDEAAHA